MRDIQYKVRAMRLSDKVWNTLKTRQKESGLSWNRYIAEILNLKVGKNKN